VELTRSSLEKPCAASDLVQSSRQEGSQLAWRIRAENKDPESLPSERRVTKFAPSSC